MENRVSGKILKLGDDINTDVILPAKYSMLTDHEELARHAFEGMGDDMPAKVAHSDIILAGKNFGCGSAREASVTCLRHAGIQVIIARSFSRTFFRNAINHGILVLQCPDIDQVSDLQDGDLVSVDVQAGQISAKGNTVSFRPFPSLITDILKAGGIVPYARKLFTDERKR